MCGGALIPSLFSTAYQQTRLPTVRKRPMRLLVGIGYDFFRAGANPSDHPNDVSDEGVGRARSDLGTPHGGFRSCHLRPTGFRSGKLGEGAQGKIPRD